MPTCNPNGASEISYTYTGTDPAVSNGTLYESYSIKTDTILANAAQEGSPDQVKVTLRRDQGQSQSCTPSGTCPWTLEAFGWVQNSVSAGELRVFNCDFGCGNVGTGVNIADGSWHRVKTKMTYSSGIGCVTVWVDNMTTPVVNNNCSTSIGGQTNIKTRFGAVYMAYSGASTNTGNVWIDEVKASLSDIP